MTRRTIMRDEVIRCATELFVERGINAVTLQDIADAVGVSKPALYHYFSNREELLREVFGDWVRTETRELQRAIPGEGSAETQLRAYIAYHVASISANIGLYSLSFANEGDLPADVRDEFRHLKRESDRALRDIIGRGIRRHEFEARHELLITFAIDGMCNWLWKWYRPSGPKSPDDIAAEFADFALNGLLAGAPTAVGSDAHRDDNETPAAYHLQQIRFHSSQLEGLLSQGGTPG